MRQPIPLDQLEKREIGYVGEKLHEISKRPMIREELRKRDLANVLRRHDESVEASVHSLVRAQKWVTEDEGGNKVFVVIEDSSADPLDVCGMGTIMPSLPLFRSPRLPAIIGRGTPLGRRVTEVEGRANVLVWDAYATMRVAADTYRKLTDISGPAWTVEPVNHHGETSVAGQIVEMAGYENLGAARYDQGEQRSYQIPPVCSLLISK